MFHIFYLSTLVNLAVDDPNKPFGLQVIDLAHLFWIDRRALYWLVFIGHVSSEPFDQVQMRVRSVQNKQRARHERNKSALPWP
jgi:hypothetical protein